MKRFIYITYIYFSHVYLLILWVWMSITLQKSRIAHIEYVHMKDKLKYHTNIYPKRNNNNKEEEEKRNKQNGMV